MKNLLILTLSFCMVFALVACGSQSNEPASDSHGTTVPAVSGNQDNNQTDISPSETDTPNTDVPGEGSGTPEEMADGGVLVAYFSCTGNTQDLAEKIASALGADIYEIVPEQPYTDADLNYNDTSSRSTKEQNDDSCRPAISGSVDNIDNYDTVIIGYPIWWGQAPKILYTFMESYDFSSKTVAAFCTSGSSPIGSSATNLHNSAPDANWLDGTRFSASASDDDIESWLSGLGLK